MTTAPPSVLFVCLGNICRSPLAKAVLADLAAKRGMNIRIDSCGTGHWHVGDPADPRTIAVAARRGVPFSHVARQLQCPQDFSAFDRIIAMDRANLATLLQRGAPAARVRLMRSFDPAHRADPAAAPDVPDPYQGGPEGFEDVFDMLLAACNGLLDELTPAATPAPAPTPAARTPR